MKSKHWTQDRRERAKVITMIEQGNIIKTAEIDRGHKNGSEIHKISDTGIITIYNKRTNKMITQLIARPAQIKRYYKNTEEIPAGLIEIAKEHQLKGYNMKQRAEALFMAASTGSLSFQNGEKKMKKLILILTIIVIINFFNAAVTAEVSHRPRNREVYITENTGKIFIRNSETPLDKVS